MTAYELASLHAAITQAVNSQLANWLAVLSVYLGAGYVVSHRLPPRSALALSAVATIVLATFAFTIGRTVQSFVGVSAEIQKVAARHEGLEWHQAVGLSEFAIHWMPTIVVVILLTLVVVAAFFFFSQRRHALQTAQPTIGKASDGPPAA